MQKKKKNREMHQSVVGKDNHEIPWSGMGKMLKISLFSHGGKKFSIFVENGWKNRKFCQSAEGWNCNIHQLATKSITKFDNWVAGKKIVKFVPQLQENIKNFVIQLQEKYHKIHEWVGWK